MEYEMDSAHILRVDDNIEDSQESDEKKNTNEEAANDSISPNNDMQQNMDELSDSSEWNSTINENQPEPPAKCLLVQNEMIQTGSIVNQGSDESQNNKGLNVLGAGLAILASAVVGGIAIAKKNEEDERKRSRASARSSVTIERLDGKD